MADSSLKEFLLKLNKNYLVLKEREAKYATAAPLDLLNQIDDYEHALELAQQAIDQNLPLEVLQTEFSGLNLQIDTIVFVSQEPPRKPFTGRNPYRGLRKFTEDEAEFFFGRTAAIQSLLDTIKHLVDTETKRELPDLITVLGPSGSGKSSLVRAGLIPALRQGNLPNSNNWVIKVMVPGSHPLDELAAQFVELTGRSLPAVRADLNTGEKAMHQLMVESLTRAGQAEESIFVLVIDQFEELFTLCQDEPERQAFLAQLLYASRVRRNRSLIVLTMRADFYGKAAAYKQLAQVITLNQMLVSPLTEKELREAILLPAEAVGLELEKALVETLLNDTHDAPGVLPLLQHTLQELFHQRDGNVLTLEAYRAMGGVKGALAHRADSILDSMPIQQRHIVRRIFMRLIQPIDSSTATRRRATFNEVLTEDTPVSDVEAVIQILTGANLIVVSRNQETGEVLLDVTHEALLEEWPRFRSWLDWDRQGLRIRQQLSLATRDWESRNRDNDSLYRGARLLEVEEWVIANPGEINPLEHAFLEASLAARDRAELERRNRTRRIIMGLTAGLILVTLGAVFGIVGQRSANIAKETAQAGQVTAQAAEDVAKVERDNASLARETAEAGQVKARQAQVTAEAGRAEAERQSQIALAQSLASLAPPLIERTNNTELATLLALQAANLNLTANGNAQALIDSSLRSILSTPYFHTVLSIQQESSVLAVAFSPTPPGHADAHFLAAGSDSGDIWLWSITNPSAEPQILRGHKAGVTSLAFSPDGLTLASSSYDGLVRLWPVADPTAPGKNLTGHLAGVRAVAFSHNGQILASASEDRTVRLWDLSQPTPEFTVLEEHEGGVFSVAFSPNDQTLASAGEDQTIRLWDLAQPVTSTILGKHEGGAIFSVAFSPNGQTLASAGSDEIIQLWDVTDSSVPPIPLPGHVGTVSSLAFSPNGQTLASAGFDQTIRLWQTSGSPTELAILRGHTTRIWSLVFSSDGQILASGSGDSTIRQWRMTTPPAKPIIHEGHRNWVDSVAFSPKGQLLASASEDGTVRLWSGANSPDESMVLEGHTDIVRAVAFSPEGQTLASAGYDGTVRLWDTDRPTIDPITLESHEGRVYAVAFNPAPSAQRQTLAAAGSDGTIRLWDVNQPTAAPDTLESHEETVFFLAFTPDGQLLASAGDDETIRLWDLAQPAAAPKILPGHENNVWSVAFSPDGQLLASAGDNGIILLWDLTPSIATSTPLRGHEGTVWSVAFSPDGQLLASAGDDGTIRLWQVAQPTAEPIILRDHQGQVLSVAFNPTGKILASASADGSVRLWLAKLESLVELACARVRRNLTLQEWRQFVGDQRPYERTCRNWPIHPSAIEAARELARQGQVEVAIAQFRYLLTLHPTLRLDPEAEAQRALKEAIQKLLNEGRALARIGEVEAAASKFQQVVNLDPSLNLDPQAEAERLAQRTAANLVDEGRELAGQGRLDEALAKFQEAEALDSSVKIAATDWHLLCAEGSQRGPTEAQAALPACNRAIELDPKNSLYYSSRGLVRSLIGDQSGALEDFKFVREQLQQNGEP